MNKLVDFPGHGQFWLIDPEGTGSGALAPLEHCDKNGNILDPFTPSYAHVFKKYGITRLGIKIGEFSDLKFADHPPEYFQRIGRDKSNEEEISVSLPLKQWKILIRGARRYEKKLQLEVDRSDFIPEEGKQHSGKLRLQSLQDAIATIKRECWK
jgi:hypothetical protein